MSRPTLEELRERGRQLARDTAPPITRDQAREAARILASAPATEGRAA